MRILPALLLLTLCATAAAQNPVLELSESGWDFGERIQGEFDQKVITISNTGQETLVIKKVEVTCGCISVDMPIKVIAVGESADLTLKLDTRRGEGEIKKFVILHSNDPKGSKLKMPMTGTIQTIWNISTHIINLGEVKNGAPFKTSFKVTVRKGYKIKLLNILTNSGFLLTEPKRFKNEDGSYGWDVTVTLSDKIQTGYFEDLIAVQTDDKVIPQRAMRAVGTILSSTKMSPKKLNFGVLIPGKKKTLTVRLEKEQGTGLEVVETNCSDKMISTEIIVIEEGKIYEVKVTVNPAADQRELRGRLHITVEEPGGVVLNVDFYGRILLP
ncbi:MAG: DUF1573 domain-containing protein [Planctomycetota bacterium]